jgi:hypothetical protein
MIRLRINVTWALPSVFNLSALALGLACFCVAAVVGPGRARMALQALALIALVAAAFAPS